MTELWAVGLAVLAAAIGSFGPIFIKKGAHVSFKRVFSNKYLLLGVLAYTVSTVIYLAALRGGELSVLYPIISLTFAGVAFLSVFMLKERMNVYKWAGIVLIIVGVSVIGLV